MFRVKMRADMSGVPVKVRAIAKNDTVGEYAATQLELLIDQFVPYRIGTLSESTVIEAWKLTYTQPYAHYQWAGEGFNYSTQEHLNATSHWETHVDKAELAQSITDYLKGL